MKTYMAKTADQSKRGWYHVDATDQVLGRLAAKLAKVLMGKHRPTYTPHVDMGDFVVVTNISKIRVTGNKAETKDYPYYTGYIGGLKANTFKGFVEAGRAEEVLKLAVKRMLPKGPLGLQTFSKLKVYAGAEHRHTAQNPKKFELTA